MADVALQAVGLFALLGGLYFGYRRWIKPHSAHLDWQGRGLLLLVILTLMGGFLGAPSWWLDDSRSFSWDTPPLASRMLASAAWSFFVVCLFALNHPSFRRIRLVLLLLLVYLAPLAIAIVLFHLDRFDASEPITYAFFVIVGVMVLSTLWYLRRQPIIIDSTDADNQPAEPIARFGLLAIGALPAIWGLALFMTDSGGLDFIWVWRGDLLSSRLIAVMLLAIAAGSFYSMSYKDTARPMLAMITTYGIGLTAASLWNGFSDKPIQPSYAIVFGLMAIVSLYLFRRQST
jgi:hypothetical protein